MTDDSYPHGNIAFYSRQRSQALLILAMTAANQLAKLAPSGWWHMVDDREYSLIDGELCVNSRRLSGLANNSKLIVRSVDYANLQKDYEQLTDSITQYRLARDLAQRLLVHLTLGDSSGEYRIVGLLGILGDAHLGPR